NAAALRSIVGYGLLARAHRKLCLTGTPITIGIDDLNPLIHALDPISWPSLNRFKARYGSGREARNLDKLKRKLRSTILVRRLLREVQKNLPTKVREVLEFSATDAVALADFLGLSVGW